MSSLKDVHTTCRLAIRISDSHPYIIQRSLDNDAIRLPCLKADAPALIAAIAEVAAITIEQIASAMGVTFLPWIRTMDDEPDAAEQTEYLVIRRNTMTGEKWTEVADWMKGNFYMTGMGTPIILFDVIAWQPLPEAWKGDA